MAATREIVTDQREQFAFHDDIAYLKETKRGLTRATVEEISAFKEEPDWMLQYRLRAYDHFVKRAMPTWTDGLDKIDFDNIVYYRKPSEREEKSWDDVPDQIKATFERLGIPEAERKFLAGVGAQYDSEVVYHSVREELTKIGVVFMGTDQALKEYPDIFKQYFGTIVPPEDNKFAALNAAVWSGGSFVYVPKGVEVPLPLQAYFRINGENTGQFERTLIVVEEGAKVHYIEGCTAPIYATESLHVAVVEVVALPRSKVRYTTIQNWSNDVYNLVTKRAHAHEGSTVEWIDANTGSRKTVKFPAIYLRGEGATADIISVAVAGKGQHQDTGAKAIHLAPNTRSRIVSKSVSKDGGRATYRGHLKVAPGATNVVASVRCDALMMDDLSRSDTYPYIDIAEDDTTMSHEATVGKVSADQVFYLMSRGLTENEATNLIVQGFLEVFTKELPMEYAIEFNRLVKLEMEGRSDDGGANASPGSPGAFGILLPVERDHLDRLTAASPDWLAADRTAAFEAFEALPPEPNLLYTTYLDLRPADLGATTIVGPGVADEPSTAGRVPATALPADEDGVLEIRDGIPIVAALSAEASAAGVTLTPWSPLLASDPSGARALAEAVASIPADDRFAQLTRALWTDGMVLDVPAGVRLTRPILLRWSTATRGVAVFGRTFIRLGDGASASVVEEWLPGDDLRADGPQSFLAGTSEIVLGAGASLSLASIQDLDRRTVAFQHRSARIGRDASLQWALAQLGSRLVRSRVDNRLEGDRSSVEQAEIVFGGTDQLFDLTSYTRHVGQVTTGNLLSKGALLENARAFLKGMITIEKSAIGTDSYLGEFGMNLSKDARSVAIPSLEIDQPDCRRAAHASSVGPIDEAQLFYLESRGIPPDEARKFIVLGFLEPVVARVPLAAARDRLRALLEAKWDANAGSSSAADAA